MHRSTLRDATALHPLSSRTALAQGCADLHAGPHADPMWCRRR